MPELLVPKTPEVFEAYYRAVVVGSLVHLFEEREAFHRAKGHRLRARRAARQARELRGVVDPARTGSAAGGRALRARLRTIVTAAWILSVAVLVADITLFGISSTTTSAADLGVMALTIAWFFLSPSDRPRASGPGTDQLE